ncbi:class I SAM-dependent methyltransferase [Methyloceanibacter stevinii]|uniref:class I SAM-dependent methyltransferase n=1 Tax=Methyloceanibacter stevinii TaxID=1774970 RepID=UPI0009F5B698|nr:class I SAM-dependent methyltransferase [Methyloceanibacter stevinii]
MLVEHVVRTLAPDHNTNALDLGCGNGLLTKALSEHVGHVTALDYSLCLIQTARSAFGGNNIDYLQADLREMEALDLPEVKFEVAWSIEVVQNLDPRALTALLSWLRDTTTLSFRFLASGIPDIERIRTFYDTDERWALHLRNSREGREQMGRWWSVEELHECAERAGLKARIVCLPSSFYTSHYRIDALFERK